MTAGTGVPIVISMTTISIPSPFLCKTNRILFRNGDVGTVQAVRPGSADLTVRTRKGVKVQTIFFSSTPNVDLIVEAK